MSIVCLLRGCLWRNTKQLEGELLCQRCLRCGTQRYRHVDARLPA